MTIKMAMDVPDDRVTGLCLSSMIIEGFNLALMIIDRNCLNGLSIASNAVMWKQGYINVN